jgi:hypothetical protein
MELKYTSAEKTTIEVVLDEGETLGNMVGPCTIFVPTDPANVEFGAILRDNPRIGEADGD